MHGVQVFDIVEILRDIKLKTSLFVLIVAVLFRRADSCLQCNDPHFCVVLVLIESFVARRIIY